MYDRRVIRGSTYAAQSLHSTGPELKPAKRTRSKPPRTPEPVEGRRHMDIQTEQYLEELVDTVPESEVTTQTDAFMDRPPTPLFVPMKIGVDVQTQIEDGDLFDFDFEVEPILEVLVGKTLEQGLMEVMEEEELAAMRAHQEYFEQLRNAELVALQRMEAAEIRKMEEKMRRIAQEKERVEREKAMREKVAAQTFARGYLNGLMGNVFDRLYDTGFFYDPVQREVEQEFMPWFTDAVVDDCSNAAVTRRCVNDIIANALKEMMAAKAEANESAKREVDAAANAKAARKAAEEEEEKEAEAERNALALRLLTEIDPPLVTEEQIAEAKTALTPAPPEPEPAEDAEAAPAGEDAPAAEDAAGGDEPAEPAPVPEPTSEEILKHFLENGAVTEEQVAKALADYAPPSEGGEAAEEKSDEPAA